MIIRRKPHYRPRLDFLEDRAVPAVDPTPGPQIFAAYSAAATAIHQAEATLSSTGTGTGTGTTGSAPATAVTVGTQAITAILTLENSIGQALSSSTNASSVTFQQLDSAGLGNQIATL